MASPQQQQQSVSPSSRRSFSQRISAVGAKINRTLSNEGRSEERRMSGGRGDPETESIASTLVDGDRSGSRSRDSGYYSSGRGGAGNIHRIPTPGEVLDADAQEFPWPRGRDRAPARGQTRSTGRGGSGNFRPSSSSRELSYSPRELEILQARAEAERNAVKSSGRGGAGNIIIPNASGWDAGARSRSRSIDPVSSPTSLRPNPPGGVAPPPGTRAGNHDSIPEGFIRIETGSR
ncbi:hypothetical protein C8R46DRAFT_1350392 [Mycena filopes]|nr:hypothetical protein C8R46DRAFT_1350392 [Mycena filopes]